MPVVYANRRAAGRELASRLTAYAGRPDVVVLGLPRGGVPVADEVASALGAPLDVFVVRKLGVPGQRELAAGAVASGGTRVINHDVTAALGVSADTLDRITVRERAELARREVDYRGDVGPRPLTGQVVILVDDGLATGATMRAAAAAVRQLRPSRVVVAVPVAAAQTCRRLADEVDEVVCAQTPPGFGAVSQHYRDFRETSDEEVRQLLTAARCRHRAAGPSGPVRVALSAADTPVHLDGDLDVPGDAIGLIVFAHGSGSSRHSPRNRYVAEVFRRRGLATLLVDLLTPDEDEVDRRTARLRFDIGRLTDRLVGIVDWSAGQPVAQLPIGLFGASTGAAAAVQAAARRPERVAAVVSRGGRVDLAGDALPQLRAPTLLLVGGRDDVVRQFNQDAAGRMRVEHDLVVVPGATHLFEEPGALDTVAARAADWFDRHLRA